MRNLVILGSTGSIGINTLEVVKCNSNKFNVYALVAKDNIDLMTKQCLLFSPNYACMTNEISAKVLQHNLKKIGSSTKVLFGLQEACNLVSLDKIDMVMSAITGISGLSVTLAALRSGKRVLLANKESLITCGKIFMNEVKKNNATLIPVDSEHSGIFQSLPKIFQHKLGYISLKECGISNIILTGSGGPFRNLSLDQLRKVTPEQACTHPNWSMGRKISVDSATMMNKGLEYIEARLLFNAELDQVEVILHPQSIIHSMIRYEDGSMLAQLSLPDMRIPIAYAMSYPNRISSGVKHLDFSKLSLLTFESPNNDRYPCLQLAIEASKSGQTASIILNAANEIAVDAFLKGNIYFTDIASIIKNMLNQINLPEPNNLEEVLHIDYTVRKLTKEKLCQYKC